jgi:hypothetical protein
MFFIVELIIIEANQNVFAKETLNVKRLCTLRCLHWQHKNGLYIIFWMKYITTLKSFEMEFGFIIMHKIHDFKN